MASTRRVKRNSSWSLVMVVITALILLSCAPSPTQVPRVTPVPQVTPVSEPGLEQKWDDALAKGKKEGTVMVYASWVPDVRLAVGKAFRDKYGIALEFATFGTSSELMTKVEAERRAGLKLADIYGEGSGASVTHFIPRGLVAPLNPVLLLPEVTDPNAWVAGRVPFVDEQGHHLPMIAAPFRTVAYNTDLVKKGEITTYRDLLKPQYKGKVVWNDPSLTGNLSMAFLIHALWGEAQTSDFITKLIREQKAVISRDRRAMIEETAKGKYAVAFGPSMATIPSFIEAKAPLDFADVVEDVRLSSGAGGLTISVEPPHPNASTVFVNWILTKEGQSLFARSFGMPSARVDASVEGVSPLFYRVPGKKYLAESGSFYENQGQLLVKVKKAMDEATR